MKKLTLTFCALFALLVVAPAYADGPERYSGKEKEVMQPAPPTCDLYRAHEWDLDIWGAYAFAADTGQFDVPNDDPFSPQPDIDAFTFNINFPPANPFGIFIGGQQIDNPNERVNIGQVSKNQLFARDDAWGGGVDMKYFWSRYFGAGVEAVGLAAKTNFAGGGLLTLTARYPFGRFAPYVTGGLGFLEGGATLYKYFHEKHTYGPSSNPAAPPGNFVLSEKEYWTVDPVYNHHARMLGQIGAGLEFRMTCHVGLMADVTWNFVFGQEDHEDKIHLIVENGTTHILLNGIQVVGIPVLHTANELRPGHGSDNQDFGMARFGVTFSY